MRFETLKSSKKKYFLYALVVGVALLLPLVLTFSRAKYKMTESIPLVKGTISYSSADLNLVAIKVQNASGEYDSSNNVPESGYTLNEAESYCAIPDGNGHNVKDSSITINYHDGVVGFDNMKTKGTKCYLYFDIKTSFSIKDILATKTKSKRSNFSSILTTDTTGIVCSTEDDDGISYYYAGAPTDNWVKFGGFYWHIIRINGDGTLRLIYNGISSTSFGEDTQVDQNYFMVTTGSYENVGYKYTIGENHGLTYDSTAKQKIDTWFLNNLNDYLEYIDVNAGFCGDREYSIVSNQIQSNVTTRIKEYSPSLKCNLKEDLYTLTTSNKGNKSLSHPAALISADEVVFAGGNFNVLNNAYYLYTDIDYWTISPYGSLSTSGMYARMLYESATSGLTSGHPNCGFRPVINLRADIALTGSGTAENPYVVQ